MTIAIGAYNNSSGVGHVRVYDWNNTAWIQRGSDIDGNGSAGDGGLGYSVSLTPDGNTLVAGASFSTTGPAYGNGAVKIYDWNGSAWIQRGVTIPGEGTNTIMGDNSGHSVDIDSAGNTVVIGAPYNNGTVTQSGHTRVYDWNGSAWLQRGTDINGQSTYDWSGWSVNISNDGNIITVGTPWRNVPYSGSGCVRIFYWNGTTWIQRGTNIIGSPYWGGGAHVGYSVGLSSTGSTVAIGCQGNTPTGSATGYIMVYDWNGTAWIQRGTLLSADLANDRLGESISISADGNSLVAGAPFHDASAPDAGQVRVFYWNGSAWIPRLNFLNGEGSGDYYGVSVCMSGDHNTVIAGGINNDGNGSNSGHARVFSCRSYTTIPVTACGSYTSPSGNYTWTTNGTYLDTIPNMVFCDSVMTIVLSLYNNSSSTISPTACDSYTAPDNQAYTSNGIYTATIPSAAGCDSIITINLTIHNSSTNTIAETACDSYTAPDNQVYTSSGNYIATIPNSSGCDSMITINLTIFSSTSNVLNVTSCDSYTAPDNQIYTASGNYVATIPNAMGCDSTISISLTINNVDTSVTVSDPIITSNANGATYQWIDCTSGNAINGATAQSFMAPMNGSYAVAVTQNNCTDTSSCHLVISIGLNESVAEDISVLSSNEPGIFLVQSEGVRIDQVEVMNASGQLITAALQGDNRIDLSSQSSGMYFVIVRTQSEVIVKKILLH